MGIIVDIFFQMKDQAPLLGGDKGRLVKYNDNFWKSSESLGKNSAELSSEGSNFMIDQSQ